MTAVDGSTGSRISFGLHGQVGSLFLTKLGGMFSFSKGIRIFSSFKSGNYRQISALISQEEGVEGENKLLTSMDNPHSVCG
jgi:hypothetical protein